MGEFNSDDHYIYYCGQESLRRNGVAIIVNKSPKCSTWMPLLLLSRFSRVRFYATPETAAHQAPLSLGFSSQEHWSGLPFPSPVDHILSAVGVTGDRGKVRCCKEQYCIGTWNVRFMNQGKLEVVKQEMARVNFDILGIS